MPNCIAGYPNPSSPWRDTLLRRRIDRRPERIEACRLRGAPRRDVGNRSRVIRHFALIEDSTRGLGRERHAQSSTSVLTEYVYSYLPQRLRIGTEGSSAHDLFAVNRDRCDRDIAPLMNCAGSNPCIGENRLVHRFEQLCAPDFNSVSRRHITRGPPVMTGCHVEELRPIQPTGVTPCPSCRLAEQLHAKRIIRLHIPEQTGYPRHPLPSSRHDYACTHGYDVQALLALRKAPAQRIVISIRHQLRDVHALTPEHCKRAASFGRESGSDRLGDIPPGYGHIAYRTPSISISRSRVGSRSTNQ